LYRAEIIPADINTAIAIAILKIRRKEETVERVDKRFPTSITVSRKPIEALTNPSGIRSQMAAGVEAITVAKPKP
jgi:hypothetical protein